jgi:hypothetical protein
MGDSHFACCLQGGVVYVEGGSFNGGSLTIDSCTISGNTARGVRARSCSKVPIAPMGDSRFARCLQGGGVTVWGGTVSMVNSQIYSNTATYVLADV